MMLIKFLAEDCEGIVDLTNSLPSDVPKWNPWVGSDCDKGLYANLAPGESRLVCIGVSDKQQVQTLRIGNATNATSN